MMRARPSVLYLVAKAPRPGVSKTRLCPPLHPVQASRLAEAFLLDALALVQRARCHARVICRDPAERIALEQVVAGVATVHVQEGAGLGDALESAFRQGLSEGFAAVGVLAADSPTLPIEPLHEAFAALDRGTDVALGPSDDGGYYLLAARALHLPLFRDIAWSTSSVAQVTLARCRQARLHTHLLRAWYDVDDAASLARLRVDLAQTPAHLAARTRSALAVPIPWGTPANHASPASLDGVAV
jgi:rSAM/selenodomain-associated transferase 1